MHSAFLIHGLLPVAIRGSCTSRSALAPEPIHELWISDIVMELWGHELMDPSHELWGQEPETHADTFGDLEPPDLTEIPGMTSMHPPQRRSAIVTAATAATAAAIPIGCA